MGNEANTPSFPYSTKYGMENEAVAHWLEGSVDRYPLVLYAKKKYPPCEDGAAVFNKARIIKVILYFFIILSSKQSKCI